MYKKTITREVPTGAIFIAPGRIKVRIKGKWVERELNSAGKMVDYTKRW